mmetsp:Transcript_30519/g.77875  ORF Transcript_30519/g.77875 Transcript_30519/m.77875 type:complete len:272 (-) Transcript_30519:1092-1907(-)
MPAAGARPPGHRPRPPGRPPDCDAADTASTSAEAPAGGEADFSLRALSATFSWITHVASVASSVSVCSVSRPLSSLCSASCLRSSSRMKGPSAPLAACSVEACSCWLSSTAQQGPSLMPDALVAMATLPDALSQSEMAGCARARRAAPSELTAMRSKSDRADTNVWPPRFFMTVMGLKRVTSGPASASTASISAATSSQRPLRGTSGVNRLASGSYLDQRERLARGADGGPAVGLFTAMSSALLLRPAASASRRRSGSAAAASAHSADATS